MSNRSETFGRLLKGAINSIATYEGKTAPIIEEELAEKVSLAGSAIQRYKAGYLPPEPQTIEIIAEAAVRRGFFSREWLQRFLHAARYHQADKLLDQLCPIGPTRPRPPRVYQNLPAPTYSQFVERKEASAEVIEGLNKRSAAVIIVGLGGNGKTSLARETADHCLKSENGTALFDAAVWVSDKDWPGTTNLSIVLDEIARTLDYPGFTQFEHDEKRREVEQLLRRQRVLVCVDNFETITDGALLAWLLNLPEPSKALITTREYRREYRRGGWPVELRGMSEGEIRSLIDQRLQQLRIERLVGSLEQLDPLIIATGGNPKAIEITLGLVKHEHRRLQQVVDDLYAGRGGLFNDLFARVWALLNEAARRVLLVATFFPTSTSAEALSASAGVQGFAFDQAIEHLADMALLDVQQINLNSLSRYALHPLVRAFAQARMAEQQDFEEGARERWIGWYLQLASQIQVRVDDLSTLDVLDPEHEAAYVVLLWTVEHQRFSVALQLAHSIGYYYFLRGIWDKNLIINQLGAQAASECGDFSTTVTLQGYVARRLCNQGIVGEAKRILLQIEGLAAEHSISNLTVLLLRQSWGYYWMACQEHELALSICQELSASAESLPIYLTVGNQLAIAECFYNLGRREEARALAEEMLLTAITQNYIVGIVNAHLLLASIDLDNGNFASATARLTGIQSRAQQYQGRWSVATIQRCYARLHNLRGDLPAASTALTEAIDLFERLGMRRELAEAREEMHRLKEVSEAPAA